MPGASRAAIPASTNPRVEIDMPFPPSLRDCLRGVLKTFATPQGCVAIQRQVDATASVSERMTEEALAKFREHLNLCKALETGRCTASLHLNRASPSDLHECRRC